LTSYGRLELVERVTVLPTQWQARSTR
jgi:hypothetical protein